MEASEPTRQRGYVSGRRKPINYPKHRKAPLRWQPASRRPLVLWAEMGGWCLLTIGLQDDGRYFARIVDKTATRDREKHIDFETIDEAKQWLSRRAQELCDWKRTRDSRTAA